MDPWASAAFAAACEAKNGSPQAQQRSQVRTELARATAAESSAKAGGERRRVIVSETFAPVLETVLEVANFAFDAFFEGVDEEFTTGEVGNSGAVVFP